MKFLKQCNCLFMQNLTNLRQIHSACREGKSHSPVVWSLANGQHLLQLLRCFYRYFSFNYLGTRIIWVLQKDFSSVKNLTKRIHSFKMFHVSLNFPHLLMPPTHLAEEQLLLMRSVLLVLSLVRKNTSTSSCYLANYISAFLIIFK